MSTTQRTKVFKPDLLLKLAAVLLVMALLTSIGTWVDDRFVSQQIVQANVWAKSLKFQLSMALQLLTVWWALRHLERQAVAWTAVTVWLVQRALSNIGFL